MEKDLEHIPIIGKIVSDGHHFVARNMSMAVSKGSLFALNGGSSLTHGFGGMFHALNQSSAQAAMGGGAAAMSGLGGIVAVGAVGVISGALAQMDYRYEVSKIKEIYRNEVASKLGKPAKSVSDDDLMVLAKGDAKRGIEANPVIAEEIAKKKSERTLGVLLSAAATVTSFVAVHGLLDAALHTAAEAITTSVGMPGLGTAIVAALDVVAGVGIYNIVKQPLHAIGHRVFNLHHETTHDRIAKISKDLSKGRGVSQEQVLGVFVSANPQLSEFVTNEYGKEFDKLTQHERKQVVNDIDKLVPLSQMTADINSGKYDVGELAFAVEGKSSGYLPQLEQRPQSWLNNMSDKLRGMFHYNQKQPATTATVDVSEKAAPAATKQDAWHPAQDHQAQGKRGFVERLEQSRSQPSLGTQLM